MCIFVIATEITWLSFFIFSLFYSQICKVLFLSNTILEETWSFQAGSATWRCSFRWPLYSLRSFLESLFPLKSSELLSLHDSSICPPSYVIFSSTCSLLELGFLILAVLALLFGYLLLSIPSSFWSPSSSSTHPHTHRYYHIIRRQPSVNPLYFCTFCEQKYWQLFVLDYLFKDV